MKYRNYNKLIDLSIDEKANNLSKRFFNVKINEKNHTPIDKSIKTRKEKIYDLLKERLLKQKDIITPRIKTNINSVINTERKTIKKNVKFAQLYEKIQFGSLGYLNIQLYDSGDTKNQKRINSNIKSLLKSRYFTFRSGLISNKKKDFNITKKSNIKKKKINKSVLGSLNLNNMDNKLNENKKKEENINSSLFKDETSEILNEDNNCALNLSSKNNLNKITKDLSFHSNSDSQKNKIIIFDKTNNTDNKTKINSPIDIKEIKTSLPNKTFKKNIHSIKSNISENSFSENNNYNENKSNMILKKENQKINPHKKSSLKELIINCLDNNNKDIIKEKKNTFSKTKKIKSSNKTKYNYTYTKSFISKKNQKVLKTFQKYITLMDKENDENSKSDDNNKNIQKNNIFTQSMKLEKEKTIKRNFYKFGSKTISSLINTLNIDQTALNNRLFKIIDRANKPIKKEKQIDQVLEIILEKKIIKKKRAKAKEIFVDALDGKKLLEERNKLRLMMRFADLIKDMNDEMALNYTKNIVENSSKLKRDFILPELAEYKELKKMKYLEKQENIRKRLLKKIGEIETQFLINEIEKENLYTKYQNIFQRNKMMKINNKLKYNSLNNKKEEDMKYHNIDLIANIFKKM